MLKVVGFGNLVEDARKVEGNVPFVAFRIASNNRRGKNEETVFIDVLAFGKMGEAMLPYLTKGKPVFVDGRLSQRKDKNGNNRDSIIADNISFLSQPRTDNTTAQPGTAAKPAAVPPAPEEDDEEIPF